MSRSPERHTFQRDAYVKRQEEKNEPVSEEYLAMFDRILEQEDQKFADPESRKNNLEYDLVTTDWILAKARASDSYAQNIYAALCNMQWCRIEMIPYLRQDPDKDLWHCSWRYAGGIVADMLQKGDYIDWYCSGISNGDEPDVYEQGFDLKRKGYVPESVVTEEIERDFLSLGWVPVPYKD